MSEDALRFADILTTASAAANYLAEPEVQAHHIAFAVAFLRGERTLDDLGRPLSPLVRRSAEGGVAPALRSYIQEWFERLGQSAEAELAGDALTAFLAGLPVSGPGRPA